MEPIESLEVRTQMAQMHDSVIERINAAYDDEKYIEVCWLCYACFESRINRTLSKICSGCFKETRTDNKNIGITTKLECYVRLVKSGYEPLKNEKADLFNTAKGWCKERNALIHGMVSLEYYNDADRKFESLAKRGKGLVNQMYELGTTVREYYYQTDEIPPFPNGVVDKCRLRKKCLKEAK